MKTEKESMWVEWNGFRINRSKDSKKERKDIGKEGGSIIRFKIVQNRYRNRKKDSLDCDLT
ncbi:hypothetical protein AGMMS49950_06360 [Endomicrobiia bacterium]|nr:hypothetical protein AGMMS49531_05970 [Endomicrobiia bacterium]GHT70793.1 hypothetical protein AGMMS49950_06360 [Endomicrobiia bacterium]